MKPGTGAGRAITFAVEKTPYRRWQALFQVGGQNKGRVVYDDGRISVFRTKRAASGFVAEVAAFLGDLCASVDRFNVHWSRHTRNGVYRILDKWQAAEGGNP